MSRAEMLVEARSRMTLRVAGAVLAGGLAITACGGGDKESQGAVPGESAAAVVDAPEVCDGAEYSTSVSFEDAFENAGSTKAVFPLLTETDGNETAFLEADEAADVIMDEVCENPYALATIMAFAGETAGMNDSGRYFLPDASRLQRVAELVDLYKSNPEAGAAAINKIASVVKAPEGLQKRDDFAVTEGQATMVARTNEGNGGFEFQDVTVTEVLEGYGLNYNTDRDLTDEEKLILEQVSDLVLITGEGELIIKQWLGDGKISFELDETTETTQVNPEEEDNQQDAGQADSDGDRTGNRTTGTQGGGGTSGSDGGGDSTGGAPGGDGPGCDGVGTGCEGEGPGGPGGPGDGGEDEGPAPTTTTTRPAPTTTSPPPTTTTTQPPTTTSPPPTTTTTQPPTTTTTQPKGEEPGPDCANNPFDPRC